MKKMIETLTACLERSLFCAFQQMNNVNEEKTQILNLKNCIGWGNFYIYLIPMSINTYLITLLPVKARIWSAANEVVESLKPRKRITCKLGSSICCMFSVTSSDVMRDAHTLYGHSSIFYQVCLFSSNSHMHYKTAMRVTTENRAWFLEEKVCLGDQSCKVLVCLF